MISGETEQSVEFGGMNNSFTDSQTLNTSEEISGN